MSLDGIERLVAEDLAKRQARGLSKYGVSVADNTLSEKEWLQHAYEEALDLAIYLKRLIDLREHPVELAKSITREILTVRKGEGVVLATRMQSMLKQADETEVNVGGLCPEAIELLIEKSLRRYFSFKAD